MPIQRLATLLRALTWAAALLVVALPPLTRSGWYQSATRAAGDLPIGTEGPGLLALAVAMPPFLAVAWGLVRLAGFCRQLARGHHFSQSAAHALRGFGWSLVIAASLLPVTRTITLAFTTQVENWRELLTLPWRAPPLLATAIGLIFGLIMIVFATILEQAKQLADENASFV